ncbi:MAG: hypothetical protein IKN83_11045 [Bacteroidaceae bacterium]|nr:hypothetical protein [Bacteroidaceae bacterium]
MKRIFAILFAMLSTLVVSAQRPFEGFFTNDELDLRCQLNLYADSIPVPGLEMDNCYGYLQGKINGTWVILKIKEMDEKSALVRAVSDRGSDGQDVKIVLTESGVSMTLVNDNNMKAISGKKYVKMPKPFKLERMQSGKK